jgi:hypothetical protein
VSDQDIDLQPYLSALLRFWRLIGLSALLVGALVAAPLLQEPQRARGTATLLLSSASSQVNLDDRFTTRDSGLFTNTVAQRNGLLALANEPAVEARAVALLSEQGLLPADYRRGSLQSKISVADDGDLIRLTANDADQAFAEALVGAWAQAYAAAVFDWYTRDSVGLAQAESELAAARERLDTAQRELETFVASGAGVAAEQELNRVQGLAEAALQADLVRYDAYRQRATQLELAEQELLLLRARIADGTSLSAADGLSVLLIRLRLSTQPAAVTLQLDALSAAGADLTGADVDQLIAAAAAERQAIDERLQQLQAAAAVPAAAQAELAPALTAAELRREQALGTQRNLTQARDMARETVEVLLNRVDSLRLADTASQLRLRLISVSSRKNSGPSGADIAVQAALGSIAGAVGAALLIIGREAIIGRRRRLTAAPPAAE